MKNTDRNKLDEAVKKAFEGLEVPFDQEMEWARLEKSLDKRGIQGWGQGRNLYLFSILGLFLLAGIGFSYFRISENPSRETIESNISSPENQGGSKKNLSALPTIKAHSEARPELNNERERSATASSDSRIFNRAVKGKASIAGISKGGPVSRSDNSLSYEAGAGSENYIDNIPASLLINPNGYHESFSEEGLPNSMTGKRDTLEHLDSLLSLKNAISLNNSTARDSNAGRTRMYPEILPQGENPALSVGAKGLSVFGGFKNKLPESVLGSTREWTGLGVSSQLWGLQVIYGQDAEPGRNSKDLSLQGGIKMNAHRNFDVSLGGGIKVSKDEIIIPESVSALYAEDPVFNANRNKKFSGCGGVVLHYKTLTLSASRNEIGQKDLSHTVINLSYLLGTGKYQFIPSLRYDRYQIEEIFSPKMIVRRGLLQVEVYSSGLYSAGMGLGLALPRFYLSISAERAYRNADRYGAVSLLSFNTRYLIR